jgi:fluoride exporter
VVQPIGYPQRAKVSRSEEAVDELASGFSDEGRWRCRVKVALIHALVVGIGGFLGALARYGLGGLVHRIPGTSGFPYGTLVVNLFGCLLIGVVAGLMEGRQMFAPEFRLFALVGILGGFTTFSTFGYENFILIRDTEYL